MTLPFDLLEKNGKCTLKRAHFGSVGEARHHSVAELLAITCLYRKLRVIDVVQFCDSPIHAKPSPRSRSLLPVQSDLCDQAGASHTERIDF